MLLRCIFEEPTKDTQLNGSSWKPGKHFRKSAVDAAIVAHMFKDNLHLFFLRHIRKPFLASPNFSHRGIVMKWPMNDLPLLLDHNTNAFCEIKYKLGSF